MTFEMLNEISDNDGSAILSFSKKLNHNDLLLNENGKKRENVEVSFYKDFML